jgi:hypothetical protein
MGECGGILVLMRSVGGGLERLRILRKLGLANSPPFAHRQSLYELSSRAFFDAKAASDLHTLSSRRPIPARIASSVCRYVLNDSLPHRTQQDPNMCKGQYPATPCRSLRRCAELGGQDAELNAYIRYPCSCSDHLSDLATWTAGSRGNWHVHTQANRYPLLNDWAIAKVSPHWLFVVLHVACIDRFSLDSKDTIPRHDLRIKMGRGHIAFRARSSCNLRTICCIGTLPQPL